MTTQTFDATRAVLKNADMFKPLSVHKTTALQTALEQGRVKADTDLLLLNHPRTPLALVKSEMAYHHVAQGEIDGEPWLVSF